MSFTWRHARAAVGNYDTLHKTHLIYQRMLKSYMCFSVYGCNANCHIICHFTVMTFFYFSKPNMVWAIIIHCTKCPLYITICWNLICASPFTAATLIIISYVTVMTLFNSPTPTWSGYIRAFIQVYSVSSVIFLLIKCASSAIETPCKKIPVIPEPRLIHHSKHPNDKGWYLLWFVECRVSVILLTYWAMCVVMIVLHQHIELCVPLW